MLQILSTFFELLDVSGMKAAKGKMSPFSTSAVSLPPAAGFGLIKVKYQQLPHAGRWGW